MHYAVVATFLSALWATTPAPAPSPVPMSTDLNCDGFGYVCGQTLPLCGCGCVSAASSGSCMKDAKAAGLVAECVDSSGARGYCAQ